MKNLVRESVLCLLAVLLTACGGGGSDTSNGNINPPSSNTSTATTTALITALPDNNYPAGSVQKAGFEYLNTERNRCGFGYLAQEPILDGAANNHARWAIANNIPGHVEMQGSPAFTGVSVRDRANSVGYAYAADTSEVFAYTQGDVQPDGVGYVAQLLGAPYHSFTLLDGYKKMGVGFAQTTTAIVSKMSGVFVMNPSVESRIYQVPSANSLRTYPCAGSVVAPRFYGENPNPIPLRNFATNPAGPVIYAISDRGTTIRITAITVTHVATSSNLTTLPSINNANDPNNYLSSNTAFVMLDKPAQANADYSYIMTGTINGTRTFTVANTFRTSAFKPGYY